MNSEKKLVPLLAVVVAAAAFAVYIGSLDNEFVWDDPIVFDRQLPYFDNAHSVFFPPPGIPQFGQHYYRPLIVVSYLIDEGLAKTFWAQDRREQARRVVYHASPVVYHALASVLVFLLGVTFVRATGPPSRSGTFAAAAAALLFAVHPGHTESVAWMAGRSDVICGLFFFGATISAVRFAGSGRFGWLVALSLLAFAGMLAKETAVGLLLVGPVAAWLVLRARPGGVEFAAAPKALPRAERRRLERETPAARGAARRVLSDRARLGLVIAGLLPPLVFYMILRQKALGLVGSPSMGGAFDPLAALGAVGWYIGKTFWPHPLSAFVPHIPRDILHLGLGLAGPVAAVVLIAWQGRRGRFARELVAVTTFFGGLAVSLLIALYSISETPLAERYLYIPTAGACLLFAFVLEALPTGEKWRVAVPASAALLLTLPASAATIQRVEVWSNNVAFWTDMVRKAPEEGIPHLHMGITYAESGQNDKAIEQYQLALKYYNDAEGRAKAHNNLGSMYNRIERFDDAIRHFEQALVEDPNYETPHFNWALTLLGQAGKAQGEDRRQKILQAIDHFETALQINPRYVKAHLQYGALLVRLNDVANGRRHLQQAAQLAPASAEGREAQRILASLSGVPAKP